MQKTSRANHALVDLITKFVEQKGSAAQNCACMPTFKEAVIEPIPGTTKLSRLEEKDSHYSVRRACIGSILAARRAGSAHAATAVSKRLPIMVEKTNGSSGLVP